MAFLDTIISAVSNIAPYHLWIYSTLLGTELYQTFVMTKVSYQALPRSAFTTLQKRVFPLYFQGQTFLLGLAAITVPPYGLASLVHHKVDWVPFTVAGVTAILNLVIYEPQTRKAMVDRIHQETRDRKSGSSDDKPSAEMQKLNRVFSKNHAMSIHLNLISVGAMLFYGWRLASRFVIIP
ncbi:hypothetical protein B0H63DRAFT_434262 [Podospora didyma]|uniref:TMEM205-like domain-containing protein n=1 Tax=Podospora didyma TaxID=330526 RepID=A0AAE0NG58_9PEZI|nr:hypothetical protein B0H63DRAFT_434262 [Podospora didyma]